MPRKKTISREQIIKELKSFYKRTGTTPKVKDANQMSFSAGTVKNRFGTWNNALIAAEIPLSKSYEISIVQCKECSKPIKRNRYRIERLGEYQFCSTSCSNIYRSKVQSRKKKKTCPECGKNHANRRIYCCDDCQRKAMNVSENTTLGAYANGKKNAKVFNKIRSIARNKMAKEGIVKTCIVCGYSLHVECCHIIPISVFPFTATLGEINALSNLVYLCPNHHWELDNGHLNISMGA